jgi:hypothetical protein
VGSAEDLERTLGWGYRKEPSVGDIDIIDIVGISGWGICRDLERTFGWGYPVVGDIRLGISRAFGWGYQVG